MSFRDFCYSNFGWIGQRLFTFFKEVEKDLDAANMKIAPEVYLSIVGFWAICSLTVPISLLLLLLLGYAGVSLPFPLSTFSNPNSFTAPIFLGIGCLIPLLVILIGVTIPKFSASSRVTWLKIEIPYASMYMSVMSSGGLSPYESLLRMRKIDLLPHLKEEVSRIQGLTVSTGSDPVSAMEKAAKVVDVKDYKDLILGYASTMRTGGDILHYLYNQTNTMFRGLSTRIKALGENMGMLMEAYTIVAILGALGLFLIFVVSLSMPQMGVSFSPEMFFLFSFVILPILSFVFIFMADISQISYPLSNWKTYMVFLAFLPVGIFLMLQMSLSFLFPQLLIVTQLQDITIYLQKLLGFSEGCDAALGLGIALLITAVPGYLADRRYAGQERRILQGVTTFLRDVVETRKTGLSPERCIQVLGNKDYGAFSKHLERISMRLSWGYPIRSIYEDFRSRVKDWLSLINIYLLVDTIEVGGGTEESLESLADFAENTMMMEKEKRALLMPLLVVPYMGAAMLTGTTILFLQFFTSMALSGTSIALVGLSRTLLTPLILHSFLLGLVTGKLINGRISAGFKQGIFLTLIALIGVWLVPHLSLSTGFGGA
jgi:flagellar protein FlaJ